MKKHNLPNGRNLAKARLSVSSNLSQVQVTNCRRASLEDTSLCPAQRSRYTSYSCNCKILMLEVRPYIYRGRLHCPPRSAILRGEMHRRTTERCIGESSVTPDRIRRFSYRPLRVIYFLRRDFTSSTVNAISSFARELILQRDLREAELTRGLITRLISQRVMPAGVQSRTQTRRKLDQRKRRKIKEPGN